MAEWIRRRSAGPLPPGVGEDLHPVLRRIYARRGLETATQLDLSLQRLAPPSGMADLERAASSLAMALRNDDGVVVVGDYDADGAAATALLVSALRALADAIGAAPERIVSLVPDRFELGYGLSPPVVERVRPLGAQWLVTVDNGVTSLEGVAAARRAGLGVVITDHHTPGERLPEAHAVVDPLREDDTFPSPYLAGVGVAFYVALAVRRSLGGEGRTAAELPRLVELLDLVAVGTVADVVPLDHNNRILVEQGLRRIRGGAARPGIEALLKLAGREPAEATAGDLAFGLGPRLNAAGRMADMTAGVACLMATEADPARAWAEELDGLNRQRRAVEAQMTGEAVAALEEQAEPIGLGVCVAADGWHQGVTGILASRLRERYHRPAVALAPGSEERLMGSARSIPGLHMRDLLARIHREHPRLIERFGGHAMAAGLTIPADRLSAFQAAFAKALEEALDGALPQPEWETDGPLATEEITLETAAALRYAGPWGCGFPEPLFDGTFTIRNQRPLRGGHLRLELTPPGELKPRWPAIAFGGVERGWDRLEGQVKAVYSPEVNRFRGEVSLQLRVEYLLPAPAGTCPS